MPRGAEPVQTSLFLLLTGLGRSLQALIASGGKQRYPEEVAVARG